MRFFVKHKSAYLMRMRAWSSVVCSSDLLAFRRLGRKVAITYENPRYRATRDAANVRIDTLVERGVTSFIYTYDFGDNWRDRKSDVSVKSVSTRVELGGRRLIKKTNTTKETHDIKHRIKTTKITNP